MRTSEDELGDPKSWRFWTGGGKDTFTGVFQNPYESTGGHEPAVITFGNGSGSSSHPVPRYMPKHNLFVMVGHWGHGATGEHFGVASAPNPWGPWSNMIPIASVDINPQHDAGNMRGLYPSLLDPTSPSLNFDTLEGDDVWLYWVQGRNKATVHAPDMARDLVRQRVHISWEEGAKNHLADLVD